MSRLLSTMPRLQFMVNGYVQSLNWSLDGQRLLATSADGEVANFDVHRGQRLWSNAGHKLGTSDGALADNLNIAASVGQDTWLRIYDASTGGTLAEIPLPSWGERVAFSADDRFLAVASGREVLIFSTAHFRAPSTDEYVPVCTFAQHQSTVTDIVWDPGDSESLATTSYGALTLWRVGQEQPVNIFRWQGSSLVASWSPNRRFIATGDQDSTVHFWFRDTGVDLRMRGFETKVLELSWDSTGRYLATGGGRTPAVWDCSGEEGPRDRPPQELPIHNEHVGALAFANHTALLASGDAEGLLAVWKHLETNVPCEQRGAPDAITSIQFDPNDQTLAAGCADGSLALYTL